MTAEALAFLAKSRRHLVKAEAMLDRWPDEAGRAAYLAGLHAAQALIFERTGRVAKTHKGVHVEFWRLTAAEPGFDADHRAFLGRTYELKAAADYLTDPVREVTPELAKQTIHMARRLLDAVVAVLPPDTAGSTQP